MDTPSKIAYTARATATGGREGAIVSSDGILDCHLTTPKELGGAGKPGTNPEQLFAAGYAACFIGAMKHVASKTNTTLPDDLKIDASVGIGPIPTGFAIAVEMKISIPGFESAKAQEIVDAAHVVCPYSNATRNNVAVTLTVV